MSQLFRIAIDGPAASGKSTTAKQLAKLFKFRYIDSGAMFRAVTVHCMEEQVDVQDQAKVGQLAQSLAIEFPSLGQVSVNGKDVTSQVRQASVTRLISPVASNPLVRQALKQQQQHMASSVDARYPGFPFEGRTVQGVVMDGRDIGTVVLPQAELKVFLIADLQARAQRRYQEQQKESLDQIMRDIEARDLADRTRSISPLKKAIDAVELDTSFLSIDQQVATIQQWVYQKLQQQ
ncbi:cytidylate kinase [Halteromyces radiatus]|uniref:cytidylate kinase n=1 Tax=Halteromyces radiatus TaxID=101107 RepID=UPI00221EA9F0|nr:cytidylate kinase [Halteromyces radiatus]KAI8093476.1 cytidylate kinase [Halteromyces radiatus]